MNIFSRISSVMHRTHSRATKLMIYICSYQSSSDVLIDNRLHDDYDNPSFNSRPLYSYAVHV